MKPVEYTHQFEKRLKQRYAHQPKVLKKFKECLLLLQQGVQGAPLNDHPLTGKLKGMRSFSIGGDIRVVYQNKEDYYLLLDIGTHNQVYK